MIGVYRSDMLRVRRVYLLCEQGLGQCWVFLGSIWFSLMGREGVGSTVYGVMSEWDGYEGMME